LSTHGEDGKEKDWSKWPNKTIAGMAKVRHNNGVEIKEGESGQPKNWEGVHLSTLYKREKKPKRDQYIIETRWSSSGIRQNDHTAVRSKTEKQRGDTEKARLTGNAEALGHTVRKGRKK